MIESLFARAFFYSIGLKHNTLFLFLELWDWSPTKPNKFSEPTFFPIFFPTVWCRKWRNPLPQCHSFCRALSIPLYQTRLRLRPKTILFSLTTRSGVPALLHCRRIHRPSYPPKMHLLTMTCLQQLLQCHLHRDPAPTTNVLLSDKARRPRITQLTTSMVSTFQKSPGNIPTSPPTKQTRPLQRALLF